MDKIKSAYFAGGCFWCMEYAFDHTDGVVGSFSGYGGGELNNPTYTNHEGHKEMIKVDYDLTKLNYTNILDIYWKNIDPTDAGGQFYDRGPSYTTVIYYSTESEKLIAEESKKELIESGRFTKPIVTEILPFKNFYIAEDYHQKYYKKNPIRYTSYKVGSGRDIFKKENWEI